jgi:hypothetical protein
LSTACHLFTTRGIRDVGIDEVIATAGIAKAATEGDRHAAHRAQEMASALIDRYRRPDAA